MGAAKRWTRVPLTGTGSYARSCAPAPPPLGVQISHTSADPEAAPLLVMTGALLPYPNTSEDNPRCTKVGLPVPSRPYWYTPMLPWLKGMYT